jgi:hypothetical protein
LTPKDIAEQAELVEKLATATIQLAFAWRDEPDKWHVEKVPILDPLTGKLRQLAKNTAEDLRANRVEIDYEPEYPLNETQFFAIENRRGAGNATTPVGGNLFPQLDNFGQLPSYVDTRRRSSPQLYVVIAQLDDQSIAKFGRRVKPSQLLKSSKFLRLLWSDGTLNMVDDGPVLALEPVFDWIEWRSTAIVLNASGFHASFRTVEALRQAVASNVETVTATLAIDNLAEFVERCQRTPSMASKLAIVVEQELYKMPVNDLQAYSTKYPELGVTWNGNKLVFDGALDKQWSILRLLDEAGFTGELSGEKFEAPSKRHL